MFPRQLRKGRWSANGDFVVTGRNGGLRLQVVVAVMKVVMVDSNGDEGDAGSCSNEYLL